jgi:hypothetical protein
MARRSLTEKVYADRSDPNILHDEITTADHALTRPWTVTRSATAAIRGRAAGVERIHLL